MGQQSTVFRLFGWQLNTGNFLLGRTADDGKLPQLSVELLIDAPLGVLLPVIGPMMIGWLPMMIMGLIVYYPSLWSIEAYQKQRQERIERKRNLRK